MTFGQMHQSDKQAPCARKAVGLALALSVQTIVAGVVQQPHAVLAAPAQVASPLCIVNGVPIAPQLGAEPYAWALLANFEHANNAAVTTICLAEKTQGNPVVYTLINCPILNNPNGQLFGNGVARFDGNAYAECSITTAASTLGPPFAMAARGTFPTPGTTYPVASTSDLALKVTTNAGCTLTPHSTYDALQFSHTSGLVGCAGVHSVFSSIVVGPGGNTRGLHRVNGVVLGVAVLPAAAVTVSTAFTLRLGNSSGGAYKLDHLIIDPRGGSCCGGG